MALNSKTFVFRLGVMGTAGILLVVCAYFFSLMIHDQQSNVPVSVAPMIAVIDTGIDLKKAPELSARLSSVAGWNFFDNNNDLSDLADHGTKVAQIVARACAVCSILPLKVAHHDAGIRPDDVASAIEYAILHKANVVNISFGLGASSEKLEMALKNSRQNGIIIVAAAGNGILNPFRASPLEEVFPQSSPDLIVVGASTSSVTVDPLMNYGAALDFIVIQPDPTQDYGSSFAAPKVAGWVGSYLVKYPKASLPEVRQLLRSSSQAVALGSTAIASMDSEHFGFGYFTQEQVAPDFEEARKALQTVNVRTYRNAAKGVELDVSALEDIDAAGGEWHCPTANAATPKAPFDPSTLPSNSLKKGRARLSLAAPSSDDCWIDVHLKLSNGSTQSLEIKKF